MVSWAWVSAPFLISRTFAQGPKIFPEGATCPHFLFCKRGQRIGGEKKNNLYVTGRRSGRSHRNYNRFGGASVCAWCVSTHPCRAWGALTTFEDLARECALMVLKSPLSLPPEQFRDDSLKGNFKPHATKATKRKPVPANKGIAGGSSRSGCLGQLIVFFLPGQSGRRGPPNLLWIKRGRLSGFR